MNENTEITLFVSENGDDRNDGSREKPLWSIAAALGKIGGKSYKKAEIVITGTITEPAARKAMVDICGKGLPPVFLRGESPEQPGILNAEGLNRQVLHISDGNSLCLGDNIVIRGGSVNGNGGAGVCIQGGTLIMEGGEISDNDTGVGMGGGVYVGKDSEFIMRGGAITRNNSKMFGGGVFADEGGVFTMRDGCIAGNRAAISGGAVYVGEDAEFALHDGTIEENQAGGQGDVKIGGIRISSGKGGGVYVDDGAAFTMYDGLIRKNRAMAAQGEAQNGGSGAGVYVAEGGRFTCLLGDIAENSASNWGGGVYTEGAFTADSLAMISYNEAGLGGGGIQIAGKAGAFTMKGGYVAHNSTCGCGGAVNALIDSVFSMEDGAIAKNTADVMGNALAIFGKACISGGAVFDNNYIPPQDRQAKPDETISDILKRIREIIDPELREANPAINMGTRREHPAILLVDTGKLSISGGILEGAVAMTKPGQMEDTRPIPSHSVPERGKDGIRDPGNLRIQER
ncbi:putative polymorphic outer membrane protein [Treponema primitia ZAS-2]|uniref:Putative polymorphic outer membrane protein n=1 Tax=Treponema primitia (strain ATCC BAA-887 / DSM 12427 / ZAS-2) TaxID=545694 RepID=F5YR13_TREPZ|nr:right-handed parallel beta-helix repeat-containing protein [Treponema primitia]AEF84544.1 putative polymorphic outer membrane protein [Treponema primitia ZAS-2]